MKKEHTNSDKPESLQQKGEEKPNKKQSAKSAPLNEADTFKLIHELKARQIELEMQNEELRLAVNRAVATTALYDFAPSGYFILDRDGTICHLNLSGARILGKERTRLVNKNFMQFVTRDTLPVFYDFVRLVFESNSKQACEVWLTIKGIPSIFVHIEGAISEDKQKCLVTAFDITDRKLKEEELIAAKARAEEMIDLMGRTIGVHPELNKGPRFYFNVPVEQTNQIGSGTSSPQTVQKNLMDLTILVADDEPINFLLIKILLSGIVKRIDHAVNGKEVVDLVSQNRYNLILMGMKMPVMGGIEATKILKQKFPELPVIAQTASIFPEEKETALRAGCDDFISKPIRKGDLMAIINKYV